MSLSNLLRFDYWLDASVTAQPAGRAMWLVLAFGVLACLSNLWLARRRESRMFIAFAVAAALIGAVGLGRILQIPVLGWRIGWLLAAMIALGTIVTRLGASARRDSLIALAIDALAFRNIDPARLDRPWRKATHLLWWGAHLLGMAIVAVNIATPRWPDRLGLAAALSPLPLLLAAAPALLTRRQYGGRAVALAPFVYAYAVALLNFAGLRIAGALNGLLDLVLALIVSGALALVLGVRLSVTSDRRFVALGAVLLITGSAGWAIWAAASLRIHGVTGSDPYAYTQMGVDLARNGTLAHAFPLVKETYALSIDSHPVTHIGYRIPTDERRIAPTVWPIGYPWFTATAWLLGGETAVFWLTPLFSLLAQGVIAWLVLQASRVINAAEGAPAGMPSAVAALAVLVTATSYQQIEWQMIPMADVASQVFSLGALGLAIQTSLQPRGARRIGIAVLAGVALGMAFNIRYTQVLIALALAFAMLYERERFSARAALRDPAFWLMPVAALLTVLPTFAYHQIWFGHPLTTGSEELSNFSLTRMPETLLRTLGELNWYREYGMLTPLIAAGAFALWRVSKRVLLTLALYALPVFVLHVFYDYLRLRDLLAIFPVISALAATGIVALWRATAALPGGTLASLARIAALFAMSFMLVLRSMETLALPVTRGFSAFGYLVREQRASFDALAAMTESNAAIGCSLNSGAVDLHAGRLAFRPGAWPADDAALFITTLLEAGTPVYLLIDSEEMRVAEPELRARFTLQEVARLNMPFFFRGSGSENRAVPLMRLTARR